MRGIVKSEHRTDTIEWNKQMNRTIREYAKSVIEGKPETIQDLSIDILNQMQEKFNMGYETDYIILNEHADFVNSLEQYIKGEGKESYNAPETLWNKELSQALTRGDILQTVRLMQIGKRLSYVKSVDTISKNSEYLARVTALLNRIQRNMDYER